VVKIAKNNKNTKRYGFALTEEQQQQLVKKAIKPENFRQFIETYGNENEETKIKSTEWKRLREIMDRVPSLQLVGDVGSGKSWLVRDLISQDKNHVFIVLDAHDEYSDLPVVNSITTDIKESCRIKLPDQPAGAVGLFAVYYNLIMNQQFPKHFLLVVEEALRYKNSGIKNLMAESRKFLKVLCVAQEKLVSYVPSITVEPYNTIRV
jgi:hypothetical protein